MEFWLYARAVWKHWWALMSCAAFTLIGFYVAYANKSNGWTVRAVFSAALGFLFVAGFLAWQDKHRTLIEAQAEIKSLHERLQLSEQKRTNQSPRLGMRVAHISDPLFSGGRLDVEFRLRLLSGRPPSSLSIEPVYSKRGSYSIRFHPLSFLAGNQEQIIEFEVWMLDTPPSRKSRALRIGWGDLLAEFVRESLVEGWGIETSPVIVNFMDGNDYTEQRFKLMFASHTRLLSVIDEYSEYVIKKTPAEA